MANNSITQGRRHARRKALQALYQWQYTADEAEALVQQFQLTQDDIGKADFAYFSEVVNGVINQRETMDLALAPHLDRDLDKVDPIERAILRLAMFELKTRLDVPYRVVINEAVELAKVFGAEQAHKFINGVLDKSAAIERSTEVDKRRSQLG